MEMITINALFHHMLWANQSLLQALSRNRKNKEANMLFAHLLTAEKVWLARLEGKDTAAYRLWEEVNFRTCEELVQSNQILFTDYLSGTGEKELEDIITYTNSKGTTFHNSKRDILLHVFLHGQYHRGQVNKKLRENGDEPVNVDYITFKRE